MSTFNYEINILLKTPRGIKRSQNDGSDISLKRTKLEFAATLPTIDKSALIAEHCYNRTKLPDDYLNLLTALLGREKTVAKPQSWFCKRNFARGSVTYFYCITVDDSTSAPEKLFVAKQVITLIKFANSNKSAKKYIY